jgi:L-proline amide hydrolase
MESTEGTVEFRTTYQGREETHRTWYRIVGPSGGTTADRFPLVTLHGGPGATHDYILAMADLACDGRAVIFYDQLGNGRSTHLPERGADFWTVDLFVRELHNLVDALGLRRGHHVLGQSWGGFLAQEYALTRPPGLQSLVLADTAASFPDFLAECNRLSTELPSKRSCASTRRPAPPPTPSTRRRAGSSTSGTCAASIRFRRRWRRRSPGSTATRPSTTR